MDRREFRAIGGSALCDDSSALVRHGNRGHGAVPAAGLSAGPLHLARRAAQESVSAAGHSALLDEFPGPDLRVALSAARYRADQYRAPTPRPHSDTAAAPI